MIYYVGESIYVLHRNLKLFENLAVSSKIELKNYEARHVLLLFLMYTIIQIFQTREIGLL